MFDQKQSFEQQFTGVKLRCHIVSGSREVGDDVGFEYKNVFEGVDAEASIEMRKRRKLKESKVQKEYQG